MHNAPQKYHLYNCNRDSHLHNYGKNCPHMFAAETVICICVAEILDCIIAIETSHLHNCNRKIHQHSSNRKYPLKTCINATDIVTCIIPIESVSCVVPTETATSRIDYRNIQLQIWCQSEILLGTIK